MFCKEKLTLKFECIFSPAEFNFVFGCSGFSGLKLRVLIFCRERLTLKFELIFSAVAIHFVLDCLSFTGFKQFCEILLSKFEV